jgi:methyl-accepting chemotaxis protein
MSQQNAALVEQCTATAALLADQATTLAQVVQRFKLSKDETRLTAPHALALAHHTGRDPRVALS